MSAQPIIAELLGGTCGILMLQHRTLIFVLSRRLLADGADPARLLQVRWASIGTVSMIELIGKLAALDVKEDGRHAFVPYRPEDAHCAGPGAATEAIGAEPVEGTGQDAARILSETGESMSENRRLEKELRCHAS